MPRKKASGRNADSLKATSPLVEAEQFDSTANVTFFSKGKTMIVNFESLAHAEKAQSVVDYENYQNLLRDLAAGKDRDESEILEICRRVDRNVAMLQEDVAWRKNRDEMIVEVRKESQYEADQAAADTELARIRAEFEKIEAEYNKKRWSERARYDRARESLLQVRQYRDELKDDCRDPNLHAELDKLESKRRELGSTQYPEERAENIRLKIVYKKSEIERMPAFSPGGRDKLQRLKADIKDLDREFEQTQLEITALEAGEAEIEQAKKAVHEKMIFA